MHPPRQQVSERGVHHALALDPRSHRERGRGDLHCKMAFAARSMARMAPVLFAVVHHLERFRGQRFAKARFNFACNRGSEEHTSELQSLMRNSYAVFCLKKKTTTRNLRHPNAYD